MKFAGIEGSNSRGLDRAAATDERVHRAQIRALYATLQDGALGSMALAIGTALTFYFVLNDVDALVWLALHGVNTLGVRYVSSRKDDPNAYVRSHFWERRYLNNIIRYSLIWALAPWLFMPADNVGMGVLLMAAMFALCTSGMLSVAWRKSAMWWFCSPMMLGLAAFLTVDGNFYGPFLACVVLLYLGVVLVLGYRLNANLVRLLVMRYQNEDLTSQLAKQVTVAEQANQEKSRFLAAASHDLRQPLYAIGLFGAALERGTSQLPDQHAHAAHLLQAVESMSQSLSAMLDISRIDAGVVALATQPVHLNALFIELDQNFKSVAAERALELRVRASDLWVLSDHDSLKRILSNLIDNALKYTREGGVLVLARLRGDSIWIDVRDTGIGIPPEETAQIFNEFYQIDNPGRDRAKGMGVGLSVVRRLAALIKHDIRVLSRLGHGSCFRVVVPLAMPGDPVRACPRSDNPQKEVPTGLPSRVLMLEDETAVGDAAMALLSSYGVELHVVRDEGAAQAALMVALAAGQAYRVLVCDYRLAGGMDGLQAGLRIRQKVEPPPALLLITGETSADRLKSVKDSGLPVLFKPVPAQTLLQALADLNRSLG